MGIPREPKPVKLFVGLLCNHESLLRVVEEALTKRFGAIELASPPFPWEVTDFYEEEMGQKLLRKFISHLPLIQPDRLAEIKIISQELESGYLWVKGGKKGREVNIDPGYLDASKVVLATTKDASHRIYLGSGIYGEATLMFRHGAFQPHDYTYPDYRWPETLSFFGTLRSIYMEQLKLGQKC